MAASEGPLASLTSDICLDYIETKTDPDIDIGIFLPSSCWYNSPLSLDLIKSEIFLSINVVNGVLCRQVACLQNITNTPPSVVC